MCNMYTVSLGKTSDLPILNQNHNPSLIFYDFPFPPHPFTVLGIQYLATTLYASVLNSVEVVLLLATY